MTLKYDLDNDNNHDHIIFLIDIVEDTGVDADITLEQAQKQIKEYLQLVAVNDLGELTTTTTAAVHYIIVKPNTEPIRQKQRRIMNHFQKDFDKVLDDMIKSGKISESKSGWASPLRLVGKKDGGVRVSHAVYNTVLDLTSAYNQVQLDPNSRKYTAFICQRGLFEYNVLPMGITNATETKVLCLVKNTIDNPKT